MKITAIVVITLFTFLSCCLNNESSYYLNQHEKKYILYDDEDLIKIIIDGDTLSQEITIESGISQRKGPLGCKTMSEEYIETFPFFDCNSTKFSIRVSKDGNRTFVNYLFHLDENNLNGFSFLLVDGLPNEFEERISSFVFNGSEFTDVFLLKSYNPYVEGDTVMLLFNLENGFIYMRDQNQDTLIFNRN